VDPFALPAEEAEELDRASPRAPEPVGCGRIEFRCLASGEYEVVLAQDEA